MSSMPLHVFTVHIKSVKSTMNKPAALLSHAKCGPAGALTPRLVSGTMCSCLLRSSSPSSEPRQSKMVPSWTRPQSHPYRSAYHHSGFVFEDLIFASSHHFSAIPCVIALHSCMIVSATCPCNLTVSPLHQQRHIGWK